MTARIVCELYDRIIGNCEILIVKMKTRVIALKQRANSSIRVGSAIGRLMKR